MVQSTDPTPDGYINIKDAAAQAGVQYAFLHLWLSRHEPHRQGVLRVRGRTYIPLSSLEAFEQREAHPRDVHPGPPGPDMVSLASLATQAGMKETTALTWLQRRQFSVPLYHAPQRSRASMHVHAEAAQAFLDRDRLTPQQQALVPQRLRQHEQVLAALEPLLRAAAATPDGDAARQALTLLSRGALMPPATLTLDE